MSWILARSLYVGTTTSIRSAIRAPCTTPDRGTGQETDRQQERQPRDDPAAPVIGRPELESHFTRPGWQNDTQKGKVAPPNRYGFAINRRVPVRIPVLAHHKKGRLRFGPRERNPH